MQGEHHIWNFLFCRISALDLVRKKLEPVAEIIGCVDLPRPEYHWDRLNATRGVQPYDEFVHEVKRLLDVRCVSDAVNKVQDISPTDSPDHLISTQQNRFRDR